MSKFKYLFKAWECWIDSEGAVTFFSSVHHKQINDVI